MKKSRVFMVSFVLMAIAGLICFSAGAALAACPDGLSAHWGLDETAGPDYSDAIGLNDGTGVAADTASPTATTAGRVGGAQVFTAASSTSIDVTESHTFNWLNTDSFSIELWVKTTGAVIPGIQVFIGREETASGLQWWIGHNTAGEASFWIQDQTGGSILDKRGVGPDLTDDLWHHLVLVRDASSGTNSFYVDNTLVDETVQNFPAGLASAVADLNIGRMDVTGLNDFYFDGVIDEVALYDRALTVDEIDDHFVAGSGGIDICGGSFSIDAPYPENTISFWNLDETAGPDYSDAIGFNDGTGVAADTASPTATTAGRVGGAQVFTAASSTSIDVTESHTFNWLNTDSFSIELWVKTTGAVIPGIQVFIGREETASGLQWWIGHNTAGEASFWIQDQTGGSILDKRGVGPDLTDDLWHHLVLVRDASSGTNSFYVDNTLVDETVQNFPAGLASAVADLNIGRMDVTGLNDFYFDGVIDEVALYDRALTVDEVDDHFVAGSAGLSVTSLRPEPVADAGANQSVSAGADVTLDGTGSSDADGTIETYQWEQTVGTSVTLSGATSDTATFTAPATSSVLTLTFRLTVTDNDGFSSTDETSVTVNPGSSVVPPPPPPPADGGGGGCFISSIF